MARPNEDMNIDDVLNDKEKKLLLGHGYKGGKSGITTGQLAEAFDPEETLVDFTKGKEDDLIKLYTAAERDIQKAINKGLLKGNNLDYLKAMQTNVQTILKDLNKGAKGWCEKATEAVYYQGATVADIQTKLAGVKAVTAGFGQVHQQAVKVLAENTYNKLDAVSQLIGRQTDDIYRHMALTAVRGTTVGYETWQQVAKNYKESLAQKGITGFVDVTGRQWNMTTYATMVARTTTMEAHLTGTANRLQENGHDLVKVSTHLKSCPKCQPWQGVVLSLTGKTAGYSTLAEARTAGLFHVNCFPAGVLVSGSSPLATFTRWYKGEIVVITTASGAELPVTPNHPILTPKGWVAAGLLNEGDNIIRYTGQKGMIRSIDPDYQDVPTPIEQVVDSFGKSRGVLSKCMPVSPKNFHGDGVGSDVYIVRADRLLGDGSNASFTKPFGENAFSFAGMRACFLYAFCSVAQHLIGVFTATLSLVSRVSQGASFFKGHPFHAISHGFGTIFGSSNSKISEPSLNCSLINSKADCNILFGFPGKITAQDILTVQRNTAAQSGLSKVANLNTVFFEDGFNGLLADMECGRELIKRLTGSITMDKIISVKSKSFCGHVYNLQTKDGWYVANSIITHNCRHAYSLALDLDAEIAKLEKELGAEANIPLDEMMAQALKTPEAQLVQNLRRTGVIPVVPDAAEVELLSKRIQVEPLPAPKSTIPDVNELIYKGSGSYLGGAGEKHIYTDIAGNEYIFKPAVTKGGYKAEPFRAHVQEAASNLGRMLYEADQVIEVKTVEIGGKIGTMQRLIPDVIGDLKKINWKVLPAEDWKHIQEEHVLDWTIGNFDAHGGNFIKLKNGRLLATDKEQSFRYLLDNKSWQMNLNYHPNSTYGEQEPIYNTIYRAFGNKEIDLDLQTVLPALKRLESISDDEYKSLFRPYAEVLKGKGPDAEGLLIAIVERKKQTREAYRQFFNQLLKKRDPIFKGQFKFLDEITETEAKSLPIAAQTLGMTGLQKLTVKSLKEMAGGKGIKYAGQMSKKELVIALSEPDNLDALVIQVGERLDELKKARRAKKMKQVVEPVAGQKIDIFDDLEVAAKSPIGFSVKKDTKMVEGQQVTIRRISIDEREGYQIYFKVSKSFHRDIGEEMKKLGSTQGKMKFYRGYRDNQTGTYISDSSSMIRKGDAWMLKDDNIEMTFVASEQLRAYTGYCEFMVFEENGKKAAAVFKNLLQKLKMDKIAADPTPDDEYLHRLSVLAWQHFPEDEIKIGLKTRTIDQMEQFLKDRGVDPQRAKKLVEKEVFPGYRTYVEEGISKEYKKAGAVSMWAGVGTDANGVVRILEPESPGLMSSVQRHQIGIVRAGSSEDQDEVSGGADSIFVRLVTKNTRSKYSYRDHFMGSGYRIVYDVKALERKDWYAFNRDSYGKTYGGRYECRKNPVEHIKEIDQNYSQGNEVMFRRGLSKEYATGVNCDQEHQRDKLIKAFKQSGINEINGIQIENFVKVRSKI